MQLNKKPYVSIYMITYNHEAFIEQAIESAMIQETTFEYKLFIGEDYSTDKTREICKELKKKYPDKIELFLNDKNLGANKNARLIFNSCFESGAKYIALLEGDDYWSDPLKLQKQVDFLEANPDYSICFHNVNILQDGLTKEDNITAKVPETTTINDLAKGNYIHTCSVVFRNNLFAEFPEYFKESPVGDYFLHLLNARYGYIKCFDDIMGVYRVHSASVWSSKTQKEQELLWVPFLENIKPNFNKEVQDILNTQIAFYTKPEEKEKKVWNVRCLKDKIFQKVKRLIQVY